MSDPLSFRGRSDGPTAAGGWTRAIVHALEARGVDGLALAGEAGIDLQGTRSPHARVPVRANARLWRRAVSATGDPGFGLSVPRFLSPAAFPPLGPAVLASQSLREALGRVASHAHVLADDVTVRVEDQLDRVRLVVSVTAGVSPAEAIDASLALVVGLARSLHERQALAPIRVRMRRQAPPSTAPFERFFRAPIDYRAERNLIEFARGDVDGPLPNGDGQIGRLMEMALAATTRQRVDPLVGRIHVALVERLSSGTPAQAVIARALGMSARTMQRRLAGLGQSYQHLLDKARADLAVAYLAAGLSVTETALELGFASSSNLARAFRRWTGRAPTEAEPE